MERKLNSDGHQFHQYQQTKQSSPLNTKTPPHTTLKIQVLAWDSTNTG